jgi:hypothetical protein
MTMRTLSHLTIRTAWAIAGIALSMGARAQDVRSNDWPLVFSTDGDQVQVFKPQPESFDGTSFTARAAVALQRPSDSTPVFGAIWGNGILAVDRDNRMGKLTTFKVTDARFPGITDPNEISGIKDMLSAGIVQHAAPVPIDWLVAALEEEKQSTTSYDNTPPDIIYREKPSILVYIDGAPIYQTLQDTRTGGGDPVYETSGKPVDRVENTPFLMVRPQGGDNWLYGSGLWYSAKDIHGPWTYRKDAPDYLQRLAQQVDTVPASTPAANAIIPEVVVSTRPAVLVDLNGKPQMQPFDNTSLMYVTNTDKDLFLDIPTQEYYLLASGRWYATKDLANGPWRYVASSDLPADFAKVPEGSPKDGILSHVAGTDAAREAVRDASIPQTAQVDRNTATVTVTYDGDPQFEQIAGTDVYSALNASTTVLRINGVYHVCDNAVWYEGSTPDGPWAVSVSVPPEVNEIPPSDPAYRVRYVYIYDHTPDQVFVGYTPGYLGSYVEGGVVIYGTGYYYDPWPGYWYPRPFTWGFNMYYNPWRGWGFGPNWGYSWFYPGWNHYGYGHYHNTWGWWGPYAYCPPVNHHAHGYYGHRPSMNGHYGTRGSSGGHSNFLRGADLYTNHRIAGVRPSEVRSTAVGARGKQPRTSAAGRAMKPIAGDHFTDSEGNVYRRDGARTQEYQKGKWTSVPSRGRNAQPDNTVSREHTPATNGRMDRPASSGRPSSTSPTRNARERSPDMQQRGPQRIQQERSRGDQRVNEYRGYQQMQRTAPPMQRPSPSIQRSAPPAPRQSAPTRSGGRRSGGRR